MNRLGGAIRSIARKARRAVPALAAILACGGGALLAQPVPTGGELQVTATSAYNQGKSRVAVDPNGNFVVVWESYGQDGSDYGIFGRLYDSLGMPRGGEFQVNTYTTGIQELPGVAMDGSGNFVVVWESLDQDGSYSGIFGQRFDSSGAGVGGEFQINTYTLNVQEFPSVAAAPGGSFVVVWDGYGLDPNSYYSQVSGQLFDSTGSRVGGEFKVSASSKTYEYNADAAMDSAGNFVVVWSSSTFSYKNGYYYGYYGVSARRFTSTGTASGNDFIVQSPTAYDHQWFPRVSRSSGGPFVVVWQSYQYNSPTDSGWQVSARRFQSNGSALGSPFQVNSQINYSYPRPDVGVDGTGAFTVVWTDSNGFDGSGEGLIRRSFDSGGNAVKGELRVNESADGAQSDPALAMNGDGSFIVTWTTQPTSTLDNDIAALRYLPDGTCAANGDDDDGDGICQDFDNCPADYNPKQNDPDMDSFGDVCDNCPADYNPSQADGDRRCLRFLPGQLRSERHRFGRRRRRRRLRRLPLCSGSQSGGRGRGRGRQRLRQLPAGLQPRAGEPRQRLARRRVRPG